MLEIRAITYVCMQKLGDVRLLPKRRWDDGRNRNGNGPGERATGGKRKRDRGAAEDELFHSRGEAAIGPAPLGTARYLHTYTQ